LCHRSQKPLVRINVSCSTALSTRTAAQQPLITPANYVIVQGPLVGHDLKGKRAASSARGAAAKWWKAEAARFCIQCDTKRQSDTLKRRALDDNTHSTRCACSEFHGHLSWSSICSTVWFYEKQQTAKQATFATLVFFLRGSNSDKTRHSPQSEKKSKQVPGRYDFLWKKRRKNQLITHRNTNVCPLRQWSGLGNCLAP